MAIKLKPVNDPSKIYPAKVYSELATGHDVEVSWEDQLTTPVDASNPNLRNLSPFIIRTLIPEFYQPFFDQVKKRKKSGDFNNSLLSEDDLVNLDPISKALNDFQNMLAAQIKYAAQYAALNFMELPDTDPLGKPVREDITNIPQGMNQPGTSDYQLTKNFKLSQFSSRGDLPPVTYDPEGSPAEYPVQANLKLVASNLEIIKATLEAINKTSVKIKIISGWRSLEHNKASIAKQSNKKLNPYGNHLQGQAVDFSASGFSIPELAAIVKTLRSNRTITVGGVGIYGSFIHYDTRGEVANWNEDKEGTEESEKLISQYAKQLPGGLSDAELNRIASEAGKNSDFGTYRSTGSSETNVDMTNASQSVNAYERARQARQIAAQMATDRFVGSFKAVLGVDDTVDSLGQNISDISLLDKGIIDRTIALDILYQLKTIQSIPPLVLLINPQSLAISYTKVAQFTERGRYGYIYQSWGDELPKMSVSGKIGAFVTGSTNGNIGPSGVQFASKRNSASFQNLANLLLFYKNNGYIYNKTEERPVSTLHSVGLLAIEYDGWVYEGNMESFSYSYAEETQNGGMEFEFEFSIERMIPPTADYNIRPPEGITVNGPSTVDTDQTVSEFFTDGLNGLVDNVLNENSIRESINTGQQLWDVVSTGESTVPPPTSETLLARNRRGFITT